MDDYFQIVKDFIPFKAFFDDILARYRGEIYNIGNFIADKHVVFYCAYSHRTQELLEYLDGNGFIIHFPEVMSGYATMYPQYPPVSIPSTCCTWAEIYEQYDAAEPDFIPDNFVDADIFMRKRKLTKTHKKFFLKYMEVARPPPI